jgi:hypothetical protein
MTNIHAIENNNNNFTLRLIVEKNILTLLSVQVITNTHTNQTSTFLNWQKQTADAC